MKKITFNHTPPVFNFLFVIKTNRKDSAYENNILGGDASFTA